MEPDHAGQLFQRGIEQFNCREFFAAHESWEEVWLAASEPDKTFLQGIIQVAAAFHHYLRGNPSGAQSLLAAGLSKLEHFPDNYRGVKLAHLREAARHWIEKLEGGQSPPLEDLPQIEEVERKGTG